MLAADTFMPEMHLRQPGFTYSDCNGTRTHNHLVRKRTLNHLAKPLVFGHIVFVDHLLK